MLLGEIALIKTGLVLTRKKAEINFDVKARYRQIGLKNINVDGTFTDEPFEEFKSKEILEDDYFTKEGDLLIRLSHPNTVVYIDKDLEGLLIPSSFAKIVIMDNGFSSDYIAWYLNSDLVKNELLKHQSGTTIPNTNKAVLEKLVIPEASLEKQQLITHVQELYWKEKVLHQELMQEKDKLFKAVSQSIIESI